MLRKLIISIVVLSLLIPIAIVSLQGQTIEKTIDYLERDQVGQATEQQVVERAPVQTKVVAEVPKNEEQQVVKKPDKDREKIERKLIIIDPGHQRYADYRLEKVAPKSDKWMPMMPASTYGVATGQAEHQLTLDVTKYLQKDLIDAGYKVKMTRNKNVIAKSVKERAQYANKHKADLYIQLHADGVTNAQASGMYVISPAKNNPHTKNIYRDSNALSQAIIQTAKKEELAIYKTGFVKSEDLNALNWSKVPTVLVELGYLNNAKDDVRLSKKSYQQKLSKTITKGINQYYE